jgi:phosphatidate phosphatase APP1
MPLSSYLRRLIHRTALGAEGDVDRVSRLLAGDGAGRKLRMLAYAGYRNTRSLRVSGRMVRFSEPLKPGETTWAKARAMMAIYNSHEVPGVTVRCEGAGLEAAAEVTSDEEGYFTFDLAIDRPLPSATAWEAVTLSTPGRDMQAASIAAPVLAPGIDDHWGVISDIDDTVIETGPTNFLKNWRRVLAERPGDRLAVPGAASLYGMIARNHAAPTRPFFYVSSSPWNLYGFLTEFMELNRIPHGPMFLKDIGIEAGKFIKAGHAEHKLTAIRTILAFYPGHRFLLMGDNGQHDVEIYAEAVKSFPERIGAVFIRDVSGTCADGAKAGLLAEIARAGVQTYCAASFSEAVGILDALGLERPVEAAKAAGQPAQTA